MPRPRYSGSRGAAPSQPGNPIKRWKEERERKKQEALDQAAREITEDTAKNEALMIERLQGAFQNCRLPKEVMEKKSDPNHPCGDLQYAVRAICGELKKNPLSPKVDIRDIDERIMTLINLLRDAISLGNVRTVNVANAALAKAIRNVRGQVPQNQPELAKEFVKRNTVYLDSWIDLVHTATEVDREIQNLDELQKKQKRDWENRRKKEEAFHQLVRVDTGSPESIAYMQIADNDTPEQRKMWTQAQRDMHTKMVDMALEASRLNLMDMLVATQQNKVTECHNRLDLFFTSLCAVEVVTDPNLRNKQQEAMERMFRDMAETDQAISETIDRMEELDGRLQQLDTAPGTIKAKQLAQKEAERMLEELKREQTAEEDNARKQREFRQRHGILSEEELRAQQEAQAAQQEVQEDQEFEVNDNQVYN